MVGCRAFTKNAGLLPKFCLSSFQVKIPINHKLQSSRVLTKYLIAPISKFTNFVVMASNIFSLHSSAISLESCCLSVFCCWLCCRGKKTLQPCKRSGIVTKCKDLTILFAPAMNAPEPHTMSHLLDVGHVMRS